jgi:site-specific DNA recombinase
MGFKGHNVGAYARYSSDRQNEASIEDQLRRLRTYAAEHGYKIASRLTFTDHAISGSTTLRPGFEALMSAVKRREIDVLLVEDTSRLSRDNADALHVYKTLAFFGVQLLALSDGIDSSMRSAKLAYSVKALMSDLYLDDLRDKTLRGLQGRAHAGLSTGALAIGYRSVALPCRNKRSAGNGFKIEVDRKNAAIVRRIFKLFTAGHSQAAIAKLLNTEGVESPRDYTRHERKTGWAAASIRTILTNERYRGIWRFNQRRWMREPGTNRRVPQLNPPSAIITYERPDLAIIADDTWELAQERIRLTQAKYSSASSGRYRRVDLSNCHVLSTLLRCECGSAVHIHGGYSKRRYYGCVNARRGRCENRSSLREDIAQRRLLEKLVQLLSLSPQVAEIRRAVAIALRRSRGNPRALTRLQRRAEALEARVRNLVDMIGDGQRSTALTHALQQAEAELALHRAEISKILIDAKHPARVASQDEVDRKLADLERQFSASPSSARETLHQLFGRRAIELRWSQEGNYRAVAILFPDVFLVERANGLSTATANAWSTSHQVVWRKRVEVPFDCELG